MSISTYDTRFFVEHYYSKDPALHIKTKQAITSYRIRYISTIVISEFYKLTLEKEGRQTAELRAELLSKDFNLIVVDREIATESAKIRHKYAIPLADSIIAASSIRLKAPCYTDDPHLLKVRELRSRWIY